MRKKLFVLCASVFALLLCACGGDTQNGSGKASAGEKSLYEHGMEAISLLDEMVKNDTYGQWMSGSAEIQKVAEQIKIGDYTAPRAVYKISVPADFLESFLTMMGEDASAVSGLSETLQADLNKRMINSISSQINSMQGTVYLAASSIYTAEKTFVSHETLETVLYLYTYENAFPVMVTFCPGEGGSMSARAVLLLDENLASAAEEDVEELLDGIYFLSGCAIERYEQD